MLIKQNLIKLIQSFLYYIIYQQQQHQRNKSKIFFLKDMSTINY
jgi:hypothetical protein